MYRIGFGYASRAPYILTPNEFFIKINKNADTIHVYNKRPRNMLVNLRDFTVQDISLINDFEFTQNEEAKAHVRKAVEQCLK